MRIPLFAPHNAIMGALLPTYVGEEQLMAFPMILPKEWIEFPPKTLCRHRDDRRHGERTLRAAAHRPSPQLWWRQSGSWIPRLLRHRGYGAEGHANRHSTQSTSIWTTSICCPSFPDPITSWLAAPSSNALTRSSAHYRTAIIHFARSPTPPRSWRKGTQPGPLAKSYWGGSLTQSIARSSSLPIALNAYRRYWLPSPGTRIVLPAKNGSASLVSSAV
jgi:hypothetical protein